MSKQLAIQKALENNWSEAVTLNLQLLTENPMDVDTLNRLAFAYIKIRDFKKAKSTYKKVIELDRSNPIALKNLKKLEFISQQGQGVDSRLIAPIAHDLFIEEAGKTKTIELVNIAEKKTLSFFQSGDPVQLTIKRSKIFAQSADDKFLGMLPDSLGSRMVTLIQGGNSYEAFIKAITDKSIVIFIREIKRATRYKNQASFTSLYSSSEQSK